jgi:hypothetical protein
MGQKRGTDASWPAIGSWVATGDVIRVDLDEAMEQLDHHWTIVTDPSGDIRAVRGGQITLHDESCTASGSPDASLCWECSPRLHHDHWDPLTSSGITVPRVRMLPDRWQTASPR